MQAFQIIKQVELAIATAFRYWKSSLSDEQIRIEQAKLILLFSIPSCVCFLIAVNIFKPANEASDSPKTKILTAEAAKKWAIEREGCLEPQAISDELQTNRFKVICANGVDVDVIGNGVNFQRAEYKPNLTSLQQDKRLIREFKDKDKQYKQIDACKEAAREYHMSGRGFGYGAFKFIGRPNSTYEEYQNSSGRLAIKLRVEGQAKSIGAQNQLVGEYNYSCEFDSLEYRGTTKVDKSEQYYFPSW